MSGHLGFKNSRHGNQCADLALSMYSETKLISLPLLGLTCFTATTKTIDHG